MLAHVMQKKRGRSQAVCTDQGYQLPGGDVKRHQIDEPKPPQHDKSRQPVGIGWSGTRTRGRIHGSKLSRALLIRNVEEIMRFVIQIESLYSPKISTSLAQPKRNRGSITRRLGYRMTKRAQMS
jgi:hypothetical protein